ncbi:hypothetical protein AGR7C_pTi0054 [Agrobacterium deltaense Zutra 3/1]|uniref:Uncharacterized protein n=1 Tax=Agrobacterium deltaense Zutra 3/1 TaxID=1183427 RepID=A0A1S7S5B2_9HYPH|nr:hypothetical protein AGR7C_pTi0054 [Agrobacterium deltaense Zutra 3/1]
MNLEIGYGSAKQGRQSRTAAPLLLYASQLIRI